MRVTIPLGGLRAGLAPLLCAVVVAACQPRQPAASAGEGEASVKSALKDDAVKAMAELAGLWVTVGNGDGGGEAPTSWHQHASSRTCMPRGSKSWELNKETTFAPGDESVSLWNEDVGALVTLYTYPVTEDLESEFGKVGSVVEQSCTEGPIMSTANGGIHFMGCVTRLESGVLMLQHVTLVQRDEWLYKVRATLPQPVLSRAYATSMSLAAQGFKPCPAE